MAELISSFYIGKNWVTIPQMNDLVPYKRHLIQEAYYNSKSRFNIVTAGRRSGKTAIAKKKLVREALLHIKKPFRGYYFAAAPTHAQAESIYWEDLKSITKKFWKKKPNESDLMIFLPNADIKVLGLDAPARIEGRPLDGGVLDEYGNMKSQAWISHVRPALDTFGREGWCDFIGVPEGRNHYYTLAVNAINDFINNDSYEEYYSDCHTSNCKVPKFISEQNHANRDDFSFRYSYGTPRNWSFFTWNSGDILSKESIEAAKNEMDEETFNQEYRGSFGSVTGCVYYAFSKENIAKLTYDETKKLHVALDFNVNPGVAVIFQIGVLPNNEYGVAVIDEIHIAPDSNTIKVIQRLLAKYKNHKQGYIFYGDATGGARKTSQTIGSDWDIIKAMMSNYNVEYKIPLSNPPERVRINSLNGMLRSYSGTRRMFVDGHLTYLIRDLEGVVYDSNGQINKKVNPLLTHMSDALGYATVQNSSSNSFNILKLGS